MVLAVLADLHDDDVDRAAVSAIEALLNGPNVPWWIKSALYMHEEEVWGVVSNTPD